jgi:hypothetical protein
MEYSPMTNYLKYDLKTENFQFEFDFKVSPRVSNFLDLAGSIAIPSSRKDLSWDEILDIAYSSE